MFDVRTAELLRSAPSLPELEADKLPEMLTRHYAELVSTRLRGGVDEPAIEGNWTLDRIADAYEIVASIESDVDLRRAAAFVAGTAQQILARRAPPAEEIERQIPLSRDGLDPTAAAAVLFLGAEQYADAFEAGSSIPRARGPYENRILADHLRDLAQGRLVAILARAERWRRDEPILGTIQTRAFRNLLSALIEGVERLAANMMSVDVPAATPSRFDSARHAFATVIELASYTDGGSAEMLGGPLRTNYAGPAHLASLLLSASEGIEEAALSRLPPPDGAKAAFWGDWLRFRAEEAPYVWRNHREAIGKGFHQTGNSAVLVLPTGAGKTTVSVLKIAACLSSGKKVVFLAPTHALVEQLTEDLQKLFPKDKFGLEVSSDFDSLLLEEAQLQDIEVMTPERCLAMLSYSPASFQKVGLLVFDECHLLSPESGKIGRALDGMLCLLAFHAAAPKADMLFLSAMLENGPKFAEWIEDLTGRTCVPVDLLWKPSRQARGVIAFEKSEIDQAIRRAKDTQTELDDQKGKVSATLRAASKRELVAQPYVVWGLQHNWHKSTRSHAFTTISDGEFQLAGGFEDGRIWATPNANDVAASIAIKAYSTGLKTIIFVNTKADAVGTAASVSERLGQTVVLNESEGSLWDALVLELGDAKHAIFPDGNFGAVPHNSAMLRLERSLSERLFRRPDGAQVIVATPTLAQGLNLPAHLAILAGDKRSGKKKGTREPLEAHELLNAAARAGRAGHLANGVVILIPEPIMTFKPGVALSTKLKDKLKSVLPEDDRCVTITDPLEMVLDRVMAGAIDDRQVNYTINRLVSLNITDTDTGSAHSLMSRSFGAFLARKRDEQKDYEKKVEQLWAVVKEAVDAEPDAVVILLATQSGLPIDVLEALRARIAKSLGDLPTTVKAWVEWAFSWLKSDARAREYLLGDVERTALAAAGRAADQPIDNSVLDRLCSGTLAWIEGKPLNEIERALGGDPNGGQKNSRICLRARELISSFVPRGLSFAIGVVGRMAEELGAADAQATLDLELLQSLSGTVRRGFDTAEKLQFANAHREILGRVQLHRFYDETYSFPELDLDDEL
ncbi:DEAD/DEAH box helicase [Rhizobium laguerreae]|uniref:DEAD/DEAH box helicase n=1 Tax=Rhizobium laguerreae TaxID=1076926 RepID=A0AB35FCQ4_9HYPH|nr:DEAD/DEAH box helicase [Rhizobium laguerreae]MBY3064469.1 DEAD/DEAH box helicase [Rhizobium laguerreae]